eukprot:1176641-Prorocentrum_minimum.AAC.1
MITGYQQQFCSRFPEARLGVFQGGQGGSQRVGGGVWSGEDARVGLAPTTRCEFVQHVKGVQGLENHRRLPSTVICRNPTSEAPRVATLRLMRPPSGCGHGATQTQKARVYSHGGPIRRRKRGYILTGDQSDAGSAGIFSRGTNQTQEAQIYSQDGGATFHDCRVWQLGTQMLARSNAPVKHVAIIYSRQLTPLIGRHTSMEYSSPRPTTAAYTQNIPRPDQSDCRPWASTCAKSAPPAAAGWGRSACPPARNPPPVRNPKYVG